MSKRANPTMIGLFLLGGLVLSILGVVAFTSNSLFRVQAEFQSSFRESVNGLAIGAKVKCQGVPIGEVTDLQLLIDLDEETFQVPVTYEIDMERLDLILSDGLKWTEYLALREHIKKGLRAQLQLESIVTGQMYIELRYVDTPPLSDEALDNLAENEIPSTFSPMASLSSEASGLVSNLRSFNVNAISENLTALLVKANLKIDELDTEGVSRSLMQTASSIRRLVGSDSLRATFDKLPAASDEFARTMADVRLLVQQLDTSTRTLTSRLDQTGTELDQTLRVMRESMTQANSMMTTDSGLGFHLQETLASLAKAADALQVLANTLEQNPSMLIRGKDENNNSGQ
ncbi:MAG: MlaD family protein [Bacteroidota bacterium]